MNIINNGFLFLAIILCAVCVFFLFTNKKEEEKSRNIKKSKKTGKKVKKAAEADGMAMSDRTYLILLAVVAVAAVAVRIYQLGSVPGGFNQDGAMAAVDGQALASHGTDRYGMRLPVHLTAWGYGQMSALLSYLLVPFIKLFGFSPLALRLPQMLVSLVGLVCLYLFIRDVFGKNLALVVLMFAAVNR